MIRVKTGSKVQLRTLPLGETGLSNWIMSMFEAQDLSCLRGQTLIFAGVEFAIDPGDALVLRGPNGSGKSSLLRVLAGLNPPLAGQLTWDGDDIHNDRQAHADRLVFVGHANAIKPPLTVRENLAFWAAQAGCEDRVDTAMEAMNLTGIADAPGRVLSSGQGRRLNLARLCLDKRPLWLLDEPTVGLDTDSCKSLEKVIAAHRASGGMVVLSTHIGIDVPDHKILDVGAFSEVIYEAAE